MILVQWKTNGALDYLCLQYEDTIWEVYDGPFPVDDTHPNCKCDRVPFAHEDIPQNILPPPSAPYVPTSKAPFGGNVAGPFALLNAQLVGLFTVFDPHEATRDQPKPKSEPEPKAADPGAQASSILALFGIYDQDNDK